MAAGGRKFLDFEDLIPETATWKHNGSEYTSFLWHPNLPGRLRAKVLVAWKPVQKERADSIARGEAPTADEELYHDACVAIATALTPGLPREIADEMPDWRLFELLQFLEWFIASGTPSTDVPKELSEDVDSTGEKPTLESAPSTVSPGKIN